MVKLEEIEATDDLNRKHALSQQWGNNRGFNHSYPGLLVMRYIERLEDERQASEHLSSLNSSAITELLTEIKWLKAELEGKNVHRIGQEQAKPITWTTTKPTKAGLHYWWRDQSYKANKPFICAIVKDGGELVCVFAEKNEFDLDDHVSVLCALEGGEWSSEPIVKPQEAS